MADQDLCMGTWRQCHRADSCGDKNLVESVEDLRVTVRAVGALACGYQMNGGTVAFERHRFRQVEFLHGETRGVPWADQLILP